MPSLGKIVFSVPVSADLAREVCAPTSLVPDTRQVVVENIGLTVNFTCQPFAPIQGNPNSHSSHHVVLLVLWYACWAVFAFCLHIFVGRYFSKPQNETESRSQSCPYRIPRWRRRAGLSPSILGEDSSLLPFANVDDDFFAGDLGSPNGRGRQSAAIGGNDMLSHSNLLTGQVSTQNALSINENDAPAANSRGSSTSQISLNLTLSTPLVSSGSAPIPHPSTQPASTREIRTHLSGPVDPPSRQEPRQDAALDVSNSHLTETTPLLTALSPLTSPPLPSTHNPNAVESRPTDSAGTEPLLGSLYPGPGNHTVDSRTTWFILVVAVTCEKFGVVDPKFDLAFLQKVFGPSSSKNVRLDWLAEGDATLEDIRAKLDSLYCNAQATHGPFRLCLYLTGMGNGDSKMCLFGDKVISEQELGSWTLSLHSQATDSQESSPISIILDFCREAMKPRDLVDPRLILIWSSSVGKPPSAYACPLGDGLPTSCFLIVVFTAANDILVGSDVLEDAIRLRFRQLGDFLQFCYNKQHEVHGQCKWCKDQGEKCHPPPPQVPEWDSAGLSMLVALTELIKTEYSEYAREVSEALTRKMEQRGFLTRKNDSHLPSGSNRASSVREARPTWRLRGVNQRTSQTMRHMG